VNKNIRKKLAKRKRKIEKRTQKRNWDNQSKPMMAGRNICYDVDGRHQAIAYGGIGAIHQLAAKTGLINEIDACVTLLKRHLPYHESDHILNIAYNFLAGGSCLQDIELLRNDEGWLNALGAQIIPDPTTAGDFLRRFTKPDICAFMDAKTRSERKSGKCSRQRFCARPSLTWMAPSAPLTASANRAWISPTTVNGDITRWSFRCITPVSPYSSSTDPAMSRPIMIVPHGSTKASIWSAAVSKRCSCEEIPTLALPAILTNGIASARSFSAWMRCPT
jgi:hypothetical protein